MPDEGPLEHYLAASPGHEPENPAPAAGRKPGPWRERGIMLGLGFLLGCIGAYALVYTEMSGSMGVLKKSLSEERESNVVLQKERERLLESLEQARHGRLADGARAPLHDGQRNSGAAAAIRPQAPPLTPLPSGSFSPGVSPPPGSVASRLVNPGPEDWKERYQYAALKYNRVVEDYNRLRKLYMGMVGKAARTVFW